jgi:hypothetical protein
MNKINSTPFSLRVFGLYLILIPGIGLMIMPDLILNMFGLRHGPELWIPRIVGLLAFVIGVLEVLIARHQVEPLYIWTVWLRLFAAILMTTLWLAGEVEVGILMFAAIDAGGALWTLLTLQKGKTPATNPA